MNGFKTTIAPHLPRLAVAIGVSLVILSLLLVLVSSGHNPADRPHILDLLANTVWSGVLVFLCLHLVALLVRAIRYRILLTASGEPMIPGLWHMILVTGFRNMMVDLLPARIGELGYVALLNRGYQVSIAACLSSLAIAVVFDFLALLLIVFIVIVVHLVGNGVEQWVWITFSMVLLVVVIAIVGLFTVLPWFGRRLYIFSRQRPHWKVLGRTADLVTKLNDAVQTTRNSGVLGKILLLSMAVRTLKYLSIFSLFVAVAGPSFPALAEVAPAKIFAAILGSEIGASLPIPTFMGFGTYEAGGTLVFSLLGISENEGLLTLLGVHIWSQAFDYGLGGLCLVLVIFLTRSAREIKNAGDYTKKRWWAIGFAGIVLLSGILAIGWQYRINQKLGAVVSPPVGEDLSAAYPEQAVAAKLALRRSGINGFVTWSSNRFGNHDILKMSLPDGRISRLTRHSHTEYYPRISPDGSRMVFARSQIPWVSQRNSVAWDLILLDLASGKEKVIANRATYPFWIDRNTVGYLQNGDQVMRHNIDSNEITLVYRSGKNNSMPSGAPITSPEISSATGELVFTARQSAIGMNTGFWGTAIWPDHGQTGGPVRGVLDGCELSWSSDGRWLYQVGHGGNQETMFYRIDRATLKPVPWLDLPGDYSHEYWPKDSNDGRYLVFGASRGEHEHDVADYEIFLWKIDSPVDSATRLTFHSGNDNWPDIYIQ